MAKLLADQLSELEEHIKTAERSLLWAKDRIEQLEAALGYIYALSTPDQHYLSAKSETAIFEIARRALEGPKDPS